MLRAYKYRLLPTPEQEETFASWFGACRFVYNIALEAKIAAWSSLRLNLSSYSLMNQLTVLKRTECLWLQDCPAQSLESSIVNLDKAFKNFFKGVGFPKFKQKTGRQSIQFRRDSKIRGNQIQLTKIGLVDFIQHRPAGSGEIRDVTVSRTPTGKYFVSIVVKCENPFPEKRPVTTETATGIDVGLKTFAVLSNGEAFANPKHLHHQLRRLRIEHRKMARRFKRGSKQQSKGWQKQKLVVAKLHEKISNQRNDFLHKTSSAITKQYDTICVENINIKGLLKNKNLSMDISDAGWYEFIRQLNYKSNWGGKNFIKIGRFEPSSKTCSYCGCIKSDLKLSDREWICDECGTRHDRDENAAKNIKRIGLQTKPSIVNVSR